MLFSEEIGRPFGKIKHGDGHDDGVGFVFTGLNTAVNQRVVLIFETRRATKTSALVYRSGLIDGGITKKI